MLWCCIVYYVYLCWIVVIVVVVIYIYRGIFFIWFEFLEDCIDFGLVVFLIIELWWSGIVEDIFWFVLILDGEYIILVFLNKLDVGGR